MQRLPRVALVSLLLGLVACGALFLFVSNMLPARPTMPQDVAVTAASTTEKIVGTKKPKLRFTFTDVAIAPLADDEREETYTFYIRNQFIGIREMQPEKEAGQKSFATWVDGLNGSIRMGQNTVPIKRITVAGYEAIAFETTEGDVRAANIITEVSGHVLLLQSQTTQEVLEEFLSKIDTVSEAGL